MLSVSMLARNEEGYLAEAIRSILPMAGEVVVVDTGSTDNTVAVAASLGAKNFSYTWHDDFAAARNFSLSKCAGEWILILDCDERVSAQDREKIQFCISQPPSAYQVVQRHYTDDPSLRGFVPCRGEYPEFEKSHAGYVETSCVRLFPRHPKIKYSGRVHELVEPSLKELPEIPVRSSEIRLHHYGHVRPAREKEKAQLYSALSLRKAAEPQAGWKEFFELGIEHKIGGRMAESEAALRRSLQLNPEHFNTIINLGFVLTELEKHTEAEKLLQFALARNEFSADAHNNIGVLYLRCRKFATARLHLEKACELHPWDVNALCNLGKVCQILGDFECSEKHYREALELVEENVPALVELGVLELQKHSYDSGISYLEKAARLAPKESRIRYYLGMGYRDQKKAVEALRELELFCFLEKEVLQQQPNPTILAIVQAVERECQALKECASPLKR